MGKKRIYIAGCGGMLGEAFYQQFKDDYVIKCTDKDVNSDWLSFLDFRDYDASQGRRRIQAGLPFPSWRLYRFGVVRAERR